MRYNRNRIYVSPEEQGLIKDYPILLAGSGIGSVIAECALRFGFENITIIDGDQVELSNLNRQNYNESDILQDKTEAIKNRLLSINKEANIQVHNEFITKENVESFVKNHKIAINALDFSSDIPLIFDDMCQENDIPILHPYNLGWAGLVAVISPEGMSLRSIEKKGEKFNELQVIKYFSGYMKFWNEPQFWIDDVLERYMNEKEDLSPPQLSIGSWMVASMCTHLLFNIAMDRNFNEFPKFHFSSMM